MRMLSTAVAICLFLCVCESAAIDRAASAGTAATSGSVLAARVDAYISSQARTHRFSGAVVVMQNDTVLLGKGYGWADSSQQIPNTAHTVYPMWQDEVTAVAILQLIDAGNLRETDKICRYISHCPATWAPITLAELLNGSSGLHDYLNQPTHGSVVGQSLSLANLVAYITREPLDSTAGQKCCSSNADIPVEEEIVERASNQSFGTYAQRHIFAPLALAQSGYYPHVPPHSVHVATGYDGWEQPAQNVERYDTSFDGGLLYTSPADYARLEQALYGGKLLSEAATTRLSTASYAMKPVAALGADWTWAGSTDTGLGDTRFHGQPIILSGWNLPDVGTGGEGLYLPDLHVSVTVFDNDINAAPADEVAQLLARMFGIAVPTSGTQTTSFQGNLATANPCNGLDVSASGTVTLKVTTVKDRQGHIHYDVTSAFSGVGTDSGNTKYTVVGGGRGQGDAAGGSVSYAVIVHYSAGPLSFVMHASDDVSVDTSTGAPTGDTATATSESCLAKSSKP